MPTMKQNTQIDIEKTRFNMVEQQIRTWNVLDDTILNLLYKIHREEFVPAAYRALAFTDMEIPLEHGAVMLTPKMEARIVQELHIKKTDKILEVGSGSGYMTALLAELGAHVHSVEIVPTLCAMAKINLQTHDITNVTIEQGDASQGWPNHAPYDVIVLTASTRATGSFPKKLESWWKIVCNCRRRSCYGSNIDYSHGIGYLPNNPFI